VFVVHGSVFEHGRDAEPRTVNHEPGTELEHELGTEKVEA
jgi:hypothetical protein